MSTSVQTWNVILGFLVEFVFHNTIDLVYTVIILCAPLSADPPSTPYIFGHTPFEASCFWHSPRECLLPDVIKNGPLFNKFKTFSNFYRVTTKRERAWRKYCGNNLGPRLCLLCLPCRWGCCARASGELFGGKHLFKDFHNFDFSMAQ